MAICHRAELRVYDKTGAGTPVVLPATNIKWSWQLGGGGFLSFTADDRAEPLASSPRLLDDCVIKVAIPLTEPGTSLTEVAAYAIRGRSGVLWGGAGERLRTISSAPTLFTAWSQDAILHPEGNAITQMAAPERYFGWMSTIYDPALDAGLWGTPSAAAGTQSGASAPRAGNPVDWPTELGGAYWITRGATANGTRHLFIADCVVPSTSFIGLWVSSDETVAAYFGGSMVAQTSSSETGYTSFEYWQGQVPAGTYRVAIDKTSVVSRGGDGRDPVLLGIATLTDTGAPDDILLLTNTSDWQVYTTDPVDGTVPSLTPGAIVAELHEQAVARGVTSWAALTLGFGASADSDGRAWPVREERAWRVAYDRYLDMLEGLGDLGFCPEITPSLILEGWSARGTDRSATVTLATLDEVDQVDESGVGISASYMPVETQDGWVVVTNATAEAAVGRREVALSLGNAPSVAQGKRLGQKVLDDRLSKPETERMVQFYARAGSAPFVDFGLGDTISLTVGASTTKAVVLDLAAEQPSTEAIIRWTAKVTGDGIAGETSEGRFATEPAQALAAGGSGSFSITGGTSGRFYATGVGTATASGGLGQFGDGSAAFTSVAGLATAAGGVGRLWNGSATFETTVGTATAAGEAGLLGVGDWGESVIAYDWTDWPKADQSASQGDPDHLGKEVWE